MNEPTHIDLFSGIGGFALAAQWAGFKTIGFCELDDYCQRILTENFGAGTLADSMRGRRGRPIREMQIDRSTFQADREPCNEPVAEGVPLPDAERNGLDGAQEPGSARTGQNRGRVLKPEGSDCAPILIPDIRNLDGQRFRGVDLITGGFPCQPFSVAGKRGGAADDRAIWPQMFRVIREAKPAWVLAENVPGIIPMELDNVLSGLESVGYACWSLVIPACAVDAKHRRDRVWIIGRHASDPKPAGLEGFGTDARQPQIAEFGNGSALADAVEQSRQRGIAQPDQRTISGSNGASWCEWKPEPDVGRVAHGIPSRVDRLKGLGNAIVPQVAYEILREIRKLI